MNPYMDKRPYHPLPRRKHVVSYKGICLIMIVTTSFALVAGFLCRDELPPGFLESPFYVIGIAIPVVVLSGWIVGSVLTYNRYIETDPDTGRKYANNVLGILNIRGQQCADDFIDVENKVISCINDTEIPYMIADGTDIKVECLCFVRDVVDLFVEYPAQYDIRDYLDDAVAAAYRDGSIRSSAAYQYDKTIRIDYHIKYQHNL